jgi:S-adenosylmethionine decarboxylase
LNQDTLTPFVADQTNKKPVSKWLNQISNPEIKDHFTSKDGIVFAGSHLLIDMWSAKKLDCLETMEAALRECVSRCGATLLHIHLHHFTPSGGISGVAVLAESHISVHTWPENGYAAFDVFMCGAARPELAVGVLMGKFSPGKVEVDQVRRGIVK